jgi:hypothetical protein
MRFHSIAFLTAIEPVRNRATLRLHSAVFHNIKEAAGEDILAGDCVDMRHALACGVNLAEEPTRAPIREHELQAPFETCFAKQGCLPRFLLADGEHDTVKGPLGLEPFAQRSE